MAQRKRKKKPRVVGTSRQGSRNLLVEHLDDGSRRIHLDDEAMALFEGQRQAFVETFGREPQDHEPIFFDPDHPEHPIPISEEKMRRAWMDAATSVGIDPERAMAQWEAMP